MINRVELIRPLIRIKEDLDRVQIPEEWGVEDIDVDFIIEFKKVYEIGIEQLQSFIDKLNDEGEELNAYTIEYYKRCLLNGPFGTKVRELAEGTTYFKPMSESMGVMSRSVKTLTNTEPVGNSIQLEPMAWDNLTMAPYWLYDIVKNAQAQVEGIYKQSLYHKLGFDNTLPEIDKNSGERYNTIDGSYTKKAHGNYGVVDSYYFNIALEIAQDILDAIGEYFEDENTYNLWHALLVYNPLLSEYNDAVSPVSVDIKRHKDDENPLKYSILRYLKDSLDRRDAKITIESEEGDKEYLIHTSDGALDS